MALRILQFGALFAIGFHLVPATPQAWALDTPSIALSLNVSDPQDVTLQKGQSATLRCNAKSTLTGLQIKWLHNSQFLPPNDSRWKQQEDGSLYIPRVLSGRRTNNVTGEYQCLVKNKAGSVLTSPAKLRVASMDRDFSKTPGNVSVTESQPAVLHCNIHSTPPADVQWDFNLQPLPHHTRYVPLPNGALLIQNSQLSDTGSYRCKATNKILNKPKFSKTSFLTVFKPSKESKPQFLSLYHLSNIVVEIGKDIALYCAVTGWPTPVVQWFDGNNIVISNSTVLKIKHAQLTHSGNYSCVATNALDIVTKLYQVDVHQKPFFNVTPISKSYPLAKTVRLDCQAIGSPDPRIHWLKDGQIMTYDARIRKQLSGLVFSHTFTKDYGIYQCVAVNAAGKVWTAAQIEIIDSHIPRPPGSIHCRPYNSTSICVSWRMSIGNASLVAYTIHTFYKVSGAGFFLPEIITNVTHEQVNGLNSSTNYTFYVRTYTTAASDPSAEVTCKTGTIGNRNLQIMSLSATEVKLKWNEVSTDISCNGEKSFYKVQWRKFYLKFKSGMSSYYFKTSDQEHNLTGLLPGVSYEFRVISMGYVKEKEDVPWNMFTMPSMEDGAKESFFSGNDSISLPVKQFEAIPISSSSVRLTWMDNAINSTYVICQVIVTEKVGESDCEQGKLFNATDNNLEITKLKPNTLYEYRICTRNFEGILGPFSQPVEVKTPAEFPPTVADLTYKIINESTICLRWQSPMRKNGKHLKYIVKYTPDRNLPMEQWLSISVSLYQKKFANCWFEGENTVSVILRNLTSEMEYFVFVRASSDAGTGKYILVTTKIVEQAGSASDRPQDLQNEVLYHQKIGIIVGVILAFTCIFCCITYILIRRRCLKRQALAGVMLAASNNYYPAVAHYASELDSVHVSLEEPCTTNVQEIQHLVSKGGLTHIPPVSLSSHLDTKGGKNFPNGINGSAKPYVNGHLPNGHVNIIENPQFYVFECNGHSKEGKKSKRSLISLRFEEDSNSNVKPSKFYDLQRIFDNSKKCNDNSEGNDRSLDSRGDLSLNVTQMTNLDDSLRKEIANHRKISPILDPNG